MRFLLQIHTVYLIRTRALDRRSNVTIISTCVFLAGSLDPIFHLQMRNSTAEGMNQSLVLSLPGLRRKIRSKSPLHLRVCLLEDTRRTPNRLGYAAGP